MEKEEKSTPLEEGYKTAVLNEAVAFDGNIISNDTVLSEAPTDEGSSEGSNKALPDNEGEKGDESSWKELYEKTQRELSDIKELKNLSKQLPEGVSFSELEGEEYERYKALRDIGLSVKEAFFAARCEAISQARHTASKEHLISSIPKAFGKGRAISLEELEVAKNLLGEDYSGEELDRLYRRVIK